MAEAEAQVMGTTTTGDLIQYETQNGIAVLTLNDPPANTYTHEMMLALDSAILKARMDEGVQVIVITGNGEKFFCAGANINMLQSVTPTFKYYFCLHANETLSRLEQTPKLVIAAINGHCVGGLRLRWPRTFALRVAAQASWDCQKFHLVCCPALEARSACCESSASRKRLS